MPEAEQREDDRLLWWLGGAIVLGTIALVGLALVLEWPAAKVGIGLQLLGIMLAALGVPVMALFLRLAQGHARRLASKLCAKAARLRVLLRDTWARLRHRPITRSGSSTVSVRGEASVSGVVTRQRVDRATVSDRDWLAHLDDRLYWQIDVVQAMEQRWRKEADELNRRLADQRTDLQRQTLAITRQGWEFILGGVLLSFIGTALGLAG